MSSCVVSNDHVLIGLPHKRKNMVCIRDTVTIASALITSMIPERAHTL